MNTDDMPYKKVTITLPSATVQKMKKYCQQEHRSQSNFIMHLIEEFEHFKKVHNNLHEFLDKMEK